MFLVRIDTMGNTERFMSPNNSVLPLLFVQSLQFKMLDVVHVCPSIFNVVSRLCPENSCLDLSPSYSTFRFSFHGFVKLPARIKISKCLHSTFADDARDKFKCRFRMTMVCAVIEQIQFVICASSSYNQ